MLPLRLTILGKPEPAGSKRAFVINGKAVVTDANKKSKPWQQEVKAVAVEHATELAEGPLRLDVTFFLQRPKGHYGSGRNGHLLKASAPEYPMVKPDATKLLRGVEDALTGIVWKDDAQIVTQNVCKRYGLPERAVIVVSPAN